ncbi:MAG: hypothetical protein WBC21_04430 [Minisyncoccales bacterium]
MDEIHINNINEINLHLVLKDIENIFWFFLLSVRTLSDYDVQNILRTKDSVQEGYLCFVQMLDKFNTSTNLQIEKKGNLATSKLNIIKEMNFMGKAMVVFVYELLFASDYFVEIKGDKEFKFLKYIRNGAAHDNKFDLKYKYGKNKGQWMLGEKEIIEWNNLKISRELQGKEVFNSFISMPSIFLLAKYFSEKLENIDKQKSNPLK